MTRSYGMIFFFLVSEQSGLHWILCLHLTHTHQHILWYLICLYIFWVLILENISNCLKKLEERQQRKRRRENSRKIICPLSPSDTITAEKLEHQLLPLGSRWRDNLLLGWENGPCFQVFGVWIHSHLITETAVVKQLLLKFLDYPFP